MRFAPRWSFAVVAVLLSAAGCGEDDPAVTGGDPGGSGGSATTSSGSGSSSGTTSTGTSSGTGGAPPCTATTLADSVRVTTVAIAGAASSRALTAQAGSGSFVAWAGTDGMAHVTPLDAADARAGADLVVEGTQVFGAAATAGDVALLVSRAPDRMTFVRLDSAGALLGSSDLVGGGDHAVEGTEWFGEFATTGRLVARGDGTYAAYHALHRRWPDGIGHQGDTLRLLDGAGAPAGGAGWDWGCSHSMDQRLSFDPGTGLVPVCIADCYPGKGIYFNHSAAELTPDPQANCAGGYSTLLGGLAATGVYSGVVAPGFFLVYQDAQGGAHLARFDASGGSVYERSLTVAGSSRLARYDAGLLLGYDAGGGTTVQQLDDSGDEVGSPAPVPAALPDQDFEGRADGEVAWATASGSTLTVVRVRACP